MATSNSLPISGSQPAAVDLLVSHGALLGFKSVMATAKIEGAALDFAQLRAHSLALDVCIRARTASAGEWVELRATLSNRGTLPVALDAIVFELDGLSAPRPLTRHLPNGEAMVDYSAMVPVAEGRSGCWNVGLSDEAGDVALVAGFERLDDAFSHFHLDHANGAATGLRIEVEREGIALAPGATLELAPLLVGAGTSLSALLDCYACLVADTMKARRARSETGWCSWYDYYGIETEADIMANARAIKQSSLGAHIRTIQIDDGWNLPTNGHARVWGDWTPGAKFPDGMKATADRIHALGFSAGLWLAPFAVDPGSQLFRDHPDWLIQAEDGSGPKNFWGVYGLDLSQDRVLDFVRETFVRVFDVWGYDYIKIDFLLYGSFRGRRARRDLTSAQCLRRGLEVIAEVARDRYVLVCGCPVGPAIGVCDAFRVGFDISTRWFIPLNVPNWPVGNCCLRAGSAHNLWRQWMHGRWWQNDPDCFRTRADGTPGEKAMFAKEFDAIFAAEPAFGLTDEEAAYWTRLVWFLGGLGMLSENPDTLPANRLALLEKAFPLNVHHPRLVDHYVDLDVVVMRTHEGPLRIGIFNVGETDKRIVVPVAKLGAGDKARWREWLTGEQFSSEGAMVAFPELPAHGGRIWERVG